MFGRAYARRPYSREVLANMLYGPSYVSLDYALQYHGLIPERVEAVTSLTLGRARRCATPVGLFIYRQATPAAYPLGVEHVEIEGGSFLSAGMDFADALHVASSREAAQFATLDKRLRKRADTAAPGRHVREV